MLWRESQRDRQTHRHNKNSGHCWRPRTNRQTDRQAHRHNENSGHCWRPRTNLKAFKKGEGRKVSFNEDSVWRYWEKEKAWPIKWAVTDSRVAAKIGKNYVVRQTLQYSETSHHAPFWFTSASQSDHYIRYVCVSVCWSDLRKSWRTLIFARVCLSVCVSVDGTSTS